MEHYRQVILDYQEQVRETGVPRALDITPVPGKATVCVGVRRAGKSTLMFQLMEKLTSEGVALENILYVNFFDDRLHALRQEGAGVILEAYFSLYPEKKNTEKVYCFFDELQVISGWEAFIDRVLRTEKAEVYITGSSAEMLSREVATQMRGRALSWELFPFSLSEYLLWKRVDGAGPFSTRQRLILQKEFEGFRETGGFPEVLGVPPHVRRKIHQEYFAAVVFRDLVERHDISHPVALFDLAHWLADNTGNLYSINRLTSWLKSLGHKVPKSTVGDFVSWFEDAYFFFSVRLFDASLRKSMANPKKIYCVDHGILQSVSSGILRNRGHLLENMVFTTLRSETGAIYYYRTANGKEVDFIALSPDGGKQLVQVTESLSDGMTRDRELTALAEAMKESGAAAATVVTAGEEETVETEAGVINITPAWRFMLEANRPHVVDHM